MIFSCYKNIADQNQTRVYLSFLSAALFLDICRKTRGAHEPTISFSLHEDKEKEIKKTLTVIYDALRQKGYNPINQIVGYILSEDPTYITTYNNARSLIRRIDRDELLQILVKSYLND